MAREDFDQKRLFVAAPVVENAVIPLDRDQANHLLTVLRLGLGDTLRVFDGVHGEHEATIIGDRKRPAVRIGPRRRTQPPASPVRLLFAPLKHARLDYMVQKAVELGAGVLQPIITHRTQATRVNLERMQANIVEAAQQCGVLAVPRLDEPASLDAALAALPGEAVVVFADEEAPVADPLAALGAGVGRAPALFIGPEGGFDDGERRLLLARQAVIRLSLGPRIMRADTAATAALTLVQAVLGDLAAR